MITTENKELRVLTYEDALKDYLQNPKALLGKVKGTDNIGNKVVFNIGKHEFHVDNEPYKLFRSSTYDLFEDSDAIEVSERFINSTVWTGKNSVRREHNRICIETPIGHFNIAPYKNGLELTRIIVDQEGRGDGTKLMKMFFSLVVSAGLDLTTLHIMLECTGAVGGGSNYRQSTIRSQTKFFRKFGFRVNQEVSNYKNGYVQMKFQNNLYKDFLESKTNP
jgi:hypothetical protein